MRRAPRTLALVAAGLVAAAPAAAQVLLHAEGWNDDGDGVRYLVAGGGGGGDDFWGLQSIGNDLGYAGQEGTDFFAGRDLDGGFGGGVLPRTVTIPAAGAIDVAGYANVTVTLRLAAFPREWEARDPDALRIVAVDDDTGVETDLDLFLPHRNNNADLESTTFPGVRLDTDFRTFTYGVPASIDRLVLRIEATSTGDLESVGMDALVVEGVFPDVLAEWRMEEDAWSGLPGEVLDESGVHDGTPRNGVTTDGALPAVAGDPGTCRYGVFDGSDDHVELPGFPDLTGDFTITAWVRSTTASGDQRVFVDDRDNSGGFAFSVGDAQDGAVRFFGRGVSPISLDTGAVLTPGAWHHVAAVHDAGARRRRVYVDGALAASGGYSGAWGTDAGPAALGGELDAAGEGVPNWRFGGSLDEIRVYDAALTAGQIATVMGETHACPGPVGGCADLFPSTIQTHGPGGGVAFGFDAVAEGDSDGVLETVAVSKNAGSSVPTCQSADCTASGAAADPVDPGPFQATASTATLSVGFRGAGTLGADGNDAYASVTLDGRATLDVSPAFDTYRIERLTVGFRSVVTLRPGDYWIGELVLSSQSEIRVAAGGTARLFVRDPVTFGFRNLVNSPAEDARGDVSRLYLHAYDTLTLGTRTTVSGAVYAAGAATLGSRSSLFGSLAAASVSTSDRARVVHDAPGLAGLEVPGVCGVAAAEVDHFEILHDGAGIHCLAETLTVTAVDAAGDPVTDYTGTVRLDTGTGRGTWTSDAGNAGTLADPTSDDGLAEYTFADADDGVAIFVLDYREGASPVDVEVADVADATVVDDDTEGPLDWSPSGFTFTAGALPNPPPSPIADPVPAQTAGTDFAVHLTAYGITPDDPTCGVIESYDGPRDVAFWSTWDDPSSGTVVPTVDGAAVAPDEAAAATRTVAFSSGRAALTVKYKDAGRIQLSAKDETPAEPAAGIRGSSNPFVVKPADLAVVAVERTDGSPNPGTSAPPDAIFVAAGAPFRVTVEARDAEGDLTPNYGNESSPEGILVSAPTLVAPPGGFNGSADDGSLIDGDVFAPALPAGTFQASTVAWDEVGAITLRASVADADYLGAGNVVGVESGTVGRFVPDHFDVSLNAPTFDTACAAGGFTYVGQPFGYTVGGEPEITVTARAAAGTTTRNYTGAWWRLTNASLGPRVYAAATGVLDTSGLPDPSVDPVVTDAGDGTGTLRFASGSGLAFARGDPVAPFDADVSLSVDVVDADGVVHPGNPVRFGQAVAGNGIPFDAGKSQRWGRLAFENAYGPETADLPVPLRTEYWVASGWFAQNLADGCTALGTASLGTTPVPGSLSSAPSLGNVPLAAGEAGLSLSAPGAGNAGHVDLVYDLSPGGSDLPWLRFDWDQDSGHDDDPTGRATFGIFAGDEALVFTREVY